MNGHRDSEDLTAIPRKRRADRRAAKQRAIAHAYRVLKGLGLGERIDTDRLRSIAKRRADHLATCSCFLCRPPRHLLGPHLMELRFKELQKDFDNDDE